MPAGSLGALHQQPGGGVGRQPFQQQRGAVDDVGNGRCGEDDAIACIQPDADRPGVHLLGDGDEAGAAQAMGAAAAQPQTQQMRRPQQDDHCRDAGLPPHDARQSRFVNRAIECGEILEQAAGPRVPGRDHGPQPELGAAEARGTGSAGDDAGGGGLGLGDDVPRHQSRAPAGAAASAGMLPAVSTKRRMASSSSGAPCSSVPSSQA